MGQTVNLLLRLRWFESTLPHQLRNSSCRCVFRPFGSESFAGRGISSLSPANRFAGFAGDFFAGDEGRGMGVDYKKLGGDIKIAHLFESVKREFTRIL